MSFRKDKVKKYTAFRSMLGKGRIESYEDDDLKTEMLALENRPTRSRTVIGAPTGYSDDLIDSFLMSCYYYVEESDGNLLVTSSRNTNKDETKYKRRGKRMSLARAKERRKMRNNSFESKWNL